MTPESWQARHRILTGCLWAEVPLLFVVGLIGPMNLVETVMLPMVVAIMGLLARFAPGRDGQGQLTGLGLIAGSFMGIELSGGQVHAHLFILSTIALVALYQQWGPLLLTVGAVVGHHLTLGLIAPERVFAGGMVTGEHGLPFGQVVVMVLVHAASVVIEVAGILLLWHFAEAAENDAERVRRQRDDEHRAAEAARAQVAGVEAEAERSRMAAIDQARTGVSERAERLRGRVGDATVAVDQLEQQADTLRRSIAEVAQRCQEAAETAANGERTASTAAEEVRRLERAMGEISEVNQMIAQLAGQTNLLSLNATIEAARAGELGKGFAVVAQEVKGLAQETAASADKVRTVIEGVVEETERVARSFATTSALVGEIHRAQNEIADSVEQQSQVLAEVAEQTATVTAATRDIGLGLTDLVDQVRSR
ncbi:MAG: methyl-accepting chemotaxis protein [Kineosporiaceae bacterium]